MPMRPEAATVAAVLIALGLLLSGPPPACAEAPGFTVEAVAPGVYAFVRQRPAGMLLDSNVVAILGDDDVIVVDANLTPSSAARTIAALRRLTPKPVRVLVNTHRHADHTGGDETYRRAFPGVEIVASAAMAEDLAAHGEETLQGWVGWARELARDLPKALASGTSLGGRPLSEELRRSYEADLAAVREIAADASDASRMQVVTPTLSIAGEMPRLVFRRRFEGKERVVEVLGLGRGHTRGDLVVWLPAERVLASGDLVVTPVPLIGADQSYVEDWVATLDRLLALGAKVTVPGHGPVLREATLIERYRDFLAAVARQTNAATGRGENAEQALEKLDVEAFRKAMAGEDKVLQFLFETWGRTPAVEAIYRVRGESAGKN